MTAIATPIEESSAADGRLVLRIVQPGLLGLYTILKAGRQASSGSMRTSLLPVWIAEKGEVRIEVRVSRKSTFLAPAPITAEVGFTSDPSPCPLPEGEGLEFGRYEYVIGTLGATARG